MSKLWLVFLVAILIFLGYAGYRAVSTQPLPQVRPTLAVDRPTQPIREPAPTLTATSAAGQPGALAPTVPVTEAVALRDQGAFVLDVREPDEWNAFHIPGSTLIPLGSLPSRLGEVPLDRPVLVVCRSGRRSQEGRDILLKAGYPAVTNMAGGLTDWRALGQPTVAGP